MLSLIHSAVKIRTGDLRAQFCSSKPFKHVVIDDFLDLAFCKRLMDEFPGFDAHKAVNELGEAGRKAVVSDLASLGGAYREFDRLMRDREFLDFTGHIAGIDRLLYDPEYTGGGTHENLEGQDLDAHIDFNYHPSTLLHRRLNLIVFLNAEWEESWGGCLELMRDPWSPPTAETRVVVPLANRAVLFETTESSWHGFKRIQLPETKQVSRRSIAVYFYSKRRPPEEEQAQHGTVYVPRPLPARFAQGYELNEADMLELDILVARRDAQIRFLYERELEHSATITQLMKSPSYRLGRILTWPLRKIMK